MQDFSLRSVVIVEKLERRKQVFPVFVLYKHQEDEESRFDNPKFVFVKETKKRGCVTSLNNAVEDGLKAQKLLAQAAALG